MDESLQDLAAAFVSRNYISQGVESLKSRDSMFKSLMSQVEENVVMLLTRVSDLAFRSGAFPKLDGTTCRSAISSQQ